MHTLLIADHRCPALAPLTERTAAVLLPVAGKPLIEHQLEALFHADLRQVTVAIHPHAAEIEARVGDGARWGLEIDFVVTHGDESVDEILSRFDCAGGDCLIVSCLRLRDQCLGDFLQQAATYDEASLVTGWSGETSLGLELRRFGGSNEERAIDLPGARSVHLATLDDYLEMNRAAAAAEIDLFLDAREVAPGVHLGRRTSVAAMPAQAQSIFIGDRTRVHRTAVLGPGTILSRDVLVDRGAELDSVVVLPGSYIGEGVRLSRAIVRGDLVLRPSERTASYVDDPALLAPLDLTGSYQRLSAAMGRVAAVFALALSAPLWPILLLASWAARPSEPFEARRVAGNRLTRRGEQWVRRTVTVWRGAAPIPWLSHLPRLLTVISGDLRWVGVAAPEPTHRAVDPGRLREAGILGPAQLDLTADASPSERRLADAFLVADRRAGRTVRWLLRGLRTLFARRAWARAPERAQRSVAGPVATERHIHQTDRQEVAA